jgi:NTP pyrophosphatase (non-canonical NTP hydrolase)
MSLTLQEAQSQVDTSIQALGGYWPPLANLARLFEECGEVARIVNCVYGPKFTKTDETISDIHEELGDALYVLIALANSMEVDLEQSLEMVITKYAQRDYPTQP